MTVNIPAQFQTQVHDIANQLGIPVDVVAEQIDTESGWDPRAVSPTGAQGLTQFEPGTWKQYGHGDPFDPSASLAAYASYMGALLHDYKGDVRKALAAYNAGGANLSAGYGYADGILSKAGATGAKATGGNGGAGGLVSDVAGSVFGAFLQLPPQVTDFFTALEKPVQGLAWFLNPTNWARILSGGLGVLLLIAGLFTLGMAV